MSQQMQSTIYTPRRRWPVILLLWLVVAAIGIAAVWWSVKITYTATAQVQVLPCLTRILYEDEQTRMMPAFDGFLHTQAQILTSEGVLREALRERSIKEQPVVPENDPVSKLRHGIRAAVIPNTYLVELSVARNHPEAAKALAKSISTAYCVRAAEAEAGMRRTRRERLDLERKRLSSHLSMLQCEIQKLAAAYQASSPAMFELIRKSVAEDSLQIQREWSKASLEVERLETQLMELKQVAATGPSVSPAAFADILPEESLADRTAAIERDLMVQAYRKALEVASLSFAQNASAKADDAKEASRARDTLAELERSFDKELERAANEHEKARLEMAARMKDVAVATLERKLSRAAASRNQLKTRVDEAKAEQMHIGQRDQELRRIQSEFDELERYYRDVAQEVIKLDIEGARPGRISVISEAEVREDGIKDRRPRLSVAIALGTLIVAVGLGFLTRRSRRPVIPPGLDPRGAAEPTM